LPAVKAITGDAVGEVENGRPSHKNGEEEVGGQNKKMGD